ncbi:MAG: tetratricopeptide repeat protein [Myxococcaceae bacterium]|nr:tetratricopeptide repeat protein [Myxococcaceae bacterium]
MTEADLKSLVQEFPDSPMGHFSLGKLYLSEQRWSEAVAALEEAVRLDATYSAAWVALGDAHAGASRVDQARAAWNQALATPHAKKDGSLRMDLEERLQALEDG